MHLTLNFLFTSEGSLFAIIFGIGSWLLIELIMGETLLIPAQLLGLVVSMISMIIGSLLPQFIFKAD